MIVGAEGGDVIHATALEVAGACVDTEGVGTLALPALEAFLASRPGIPAGELGHIWCRIRSAAFESPKHNVELLDAQLFRKYDKGGAGTISGNDLRRGLKHLKTMKPQLAPVALATLRAHFGVAGGGGVVVDGGLDAPVDYLRLVSWLNPVSHFVR